MNLKLERIRKSYGRKKVLQGIDMELSQGIYGFLGANGVGKTTLFKIISGYTRDYQGSVSYPKCKKGEVLLGVLPQNFIGYPTMTVREFLTYMANMKTEASKQDVRMEIEEKMELFAVEELHRKKLKALSGGQLRRVGLAQSFLFSPKLVLLDEPTAGLDPAERIRFKNFISDAAKEQTILLSTHIVSDLEFICREIFVIKDGIVAEQGTQEELLRRQEGNVWECAFENERQMHEALAGAAVSMTYSDQGMVKARVVGARPVPDAYQIQPALNDVYLSIFRFQQEGQDEV